MNLIELTEQDKQEYNHFVASQPSGSFLQSWEWGEWQQSLGRKVYRFKIEEGKEQVGSIQLIQMPLPTGKVYLYAPYGPVMANGKFLTASFKILLSDLQEKFPAAVFFRIEPKAVVVELVSIAKKTLNIQPAKTLVLDLTKSEEEILGQMHHKTRYNIKVARKHGVEIQREFNISVGHGLFFNEALKLVVETSGRQKYQSYPLSYYVTLVDFFMLRKSDIVVHIYKAIFQNQLLASAVLVDFGQTRNFLFGGSSEFHKNVMAPYLLHYTAITDAKKQKIAQYDFWGSETARGSTPGFVRFKMGFGGIEQEYGGAYDVVSRPAVYKTYQIMRAINRFWP